MELIRREFVAEVPLALAWRHLADVQQWPRWAPHIRQVDLTPPNGLTPTTTGVFWLSNGVTTQFRMTELNPPQHWRWTGAFLWLRIDYDHHFEALDEHHTKLRWIVAAEGWGVSLVGKLFAALYNRNLDRAIPRLVTELKSVQA